jgi:hypothetical protein
LPIPTALSGSEEGITRQREAQTDSSEYLAGLCWMLGSNLRMAKGGIFNSFFMIMWTSSAIYRPNYSAPLGHNDQRAPMCTEDVPKNRNFSLSLLEPLPAAAVWSGGIFGWSATIATVGPLEGLQVKSIALEHRLQWKEKGFWRIWTVSVSRFEAIFWWLRRI